MTLHEPYAFVAGVSNGTALPFGLKSPARNGLVPGLSLHLSARPRDGSVTAMPHAERTSPDYRSAVREKLLDLRGLRGGWGPDADGKPITEHALYLVQSILDALDEEANRCVAIVPNTDGGVQLEWGPGQHEVEVLIDPTEDEFSVFIRGGDRFGFDAHLTESDLRRLENDVAWALD